MLLGHSTGLTFLRFCQQDTLDSLLQNYVSDLITQSDELLKRTDTDEIYVNQTARDRLSSLLQAVRLLRSCITAISREGAPSSSQLAKRTTLPRPDSLEPALGETPRSGRKSPNEQTSTRASANDGIGTWLANVPSFEDAQPLSYSAIEQTTIPRRLLIPPSRNDMTPSRGTFYTDDGAASSPTLVPPESRLKSPTAGVLTSRERQALGYNLRLDTRRNKCRSIHQRCLAQTSLSFRSRSLQTGSL